MQPVDLFRPDLEVGEIHALFDLEPDEIRQVKIEAAQDMLKAENILDGERVGAMIQLLSYARLEMPEFFASTLDLDVESAAVYSNAIINSMCIMLTKTCPSWAVVDLEGLSVNRGIAVYSTAFLDFITDVLAKAAPFAFEFANDAEADNGYDFMNAVQDGFTLFALEAFKEFEGDVFLTPEIATTLKFKALTRCAL